jgi:hypothetical protein
MDNVGPQQSAERLLAWLASTDKAWLIALDDLQDPGDIRGLWPPNTQTGQVLITTRRRDATLTHLGRAVFDIDVFTPEESVAYLHAALASHEYLAEGAPGLAADLGHLPLALAQAVAYLIDRDLSCESYRARLADRRRSLTEVFPARGELPDDQRTTIAATWSLSVELANRLAPAGVARPFLEIASLLDPHGFPIEVITNGPILNYLMRLLNRDVDADDVHDASRCLHRLSLATIDRGHRARTVRIHALVQRAVRERLVDREIARIAPVVGDALLELWPTRERDSQFAQSLRSNTEALRRNAGPHLWRLKEHQVLRRAGLSLCDAGLAEAAMAHQQQLFDAASTYLGPEHRDTLAARRERARMRGEAGDPAGAVEEFMPLLADYLQILGPRDTDTLSTRRHFGYWRRKAGDLAGGIAEYQKLLADNERVLGSDHPDTLTVRANLAVWQGDTGDARGAIAAVTALLNDLERVLGPDDLQTLWNRSNLAKLRGVAGDASGARDSYQALLDDHLRVLGAEHPHTLRVRRHLANWQGQAGDPVGAAKACEALLADYLRIMGPNHPYTAVIGDDMEHWYNKKE